MNYKDKAAEDWIKFVHERFKEHHMAEEKKIPWWKRWGLQILKFGYAIFAIKMKEAQDREKGIEK